MFLVIASSKQFRNILLEGSQGADSFASVLTFKRKVWLSNPEPLGPPRETLSQDGNTTVVCFLNQQAEKVNIVSEDDYPPGVRLVVASVDLSKR